MSSIINKPTIQSSANWTNSKHDVSVKKSDGKKIDTSDLTQAQLDDLKGDIDKLAEGLEEQVLGSLTEGSFGLTKEAVQAFFDAQVSDLIEIKEKYGHSQDGLSTHNIQSEFSAGYDTGIRELIKKPATALAESQLEGQIPEGYADKVFDESTVAFDAAKAMVNQFSQMLAQRMLQNPQLANQVNQASGGNYVLPTPNGLQSIDLGAMAAQIPQLAGMLQGSAAVNNFKMQQAPASINTLIQNLNRGNQQMTALQGMAANSPALIGAGNQAAGGANVAGQQMQAIQASTAGQGFHTAMTSQNGGMGFEQLMFALMSELMKDSTEELGQAAANIKGIKNADDKEVAMQKIQQMAALRSQMTQMFANILKKIDDSAMNTIRKI